MTIVCLHHQHNLLREKVLEILETCPVFQTKHHNHELAEPTTRTSRLLEHTETEETHETPSLHGQSLEDITATTTTTRKTILLDPVGATRGRKT